MNRRSLLLATLTWVPFSLAAPAAGAARMCVSPETLAVAPGAEFTLELRVPVAGSPFNGYDAVVEYDPAKLTFLPTSPLSLQEGSDMRGACGNTFHIFSAAGDSLSISHSLLCANVSLTGPAQLYQLRFRASNTAGATQVRLRRAQFYNGGTYVNPTLTSDALVSWGGVLGAGPSWDLTGPRLAVRGNPARGEQWFDLASPVAGVQRLVVLDLAGRTVRRLDAGMRPAGSRSLSWDGRDDAGRLVPAGIYLAHYDAAGRSARASLIRLP